jgi:adenylate cyclase
MFFKTKSMKSPAAFGLLIVAAVCAGLIALRGAGKLQFLELALYDSYLQFQPQIHTPENRVLLVTISETDIQNLGSWPMSDGTMARLLKNVLRCEPRAVGLDIYRDLPVPPGGEELLELFSKPARVVTVQKLGDEKSPGVGRPYVTRDSGLVGFNDLVVDSEGVVRRGLLYVTEGDRFHQSFSLLLALSYLEPENIFPEGDPSDPDVMKLGKAKFLPLEPDEGGYCGVDARGYQFLLDFSAAAVPFASVSFTDVLAGKLPPELARGKAVLIGSVAESSRDFFHIPVDRSTEPRRQITGVELQASIVSQLLHGALNGFQPMRSIGELHKQGWIVLWSGAGFLLGLWSRSFRRFLLANLLALVVLTGISFSLFRAGYWIPVAPPALAVTLTAALLVAYVSYQEKMQRAVLMRLFSTQVSRDVAETLWSHRDQFMEGGRPRPQELTATVLFTDLRGYTTVTERMEPRALVEWLNEYMERMAKAVMDHGGIVHRYIGDAVMATFGIPIARTVEEEISRDAANAVECAAAMGKELERLNLSWSGRGLPTAKMRVGIYTGPLLVGYLGSMQRMEYSIFGDTANIAARLESYDKEYQSEATCRIIIGGPTWERVNGGFLTRDLGEAVLKGKDVKVRIYHVLGEKGRPDPILAHGPLSTE